MARREPTGSAGEGGRAGRRPELGKVPGGPGGWLGAACRGQAILRHPGPPGLG